VRGPRGMATSRDAIDAAVRSLAAAVETADPAALAGVAQDMRQRPGPPAGAFKRP
jgi:hypothetical protein